MSIQFYSEAKPVKRTIKSVEQIRTEIEQINDQLLNGSPSLYQAIQLRRWLGSLQAIVEVKMGFTLPAHRAAWSGVMSVMRVLIHTYLTEEELEFAATAK